MYLLVCCSLIEKQNGPATMQRRRNPLCMIVYWFRRVRKTHQFLKLAKRIDCRERHENVISVTKKTKKWPKLLMVYAVFMYNHIIRNRGNQYRYCKLSWIVHLLSQNVMEMYVCHCFLPIPKAQRRTARIRKTTCIWQTDAALCCVSQRPPAKTLRRGYKTRRHV